MNTWRGSTCAVGYCDDQASPQIRALPLCHRHGMEVAHAFREPIVAEHELRRLHAEKQRTEAAESKRGNREGGTVYYARIGDYIKIGYSARLRNRLGQLRIDELLAVEPGDPALERVRHREFAAERIDRRRENFQPSERLLGHVAALRGTHDLPTWAKRPRTSIVTVTTKGAPK